MKNFVIIQIITFIFLMSIAALYLNYAHKNRVQGVVLNEQELVDSNYKTVTHAFEKNAQILFASTINTQDIREIMYRASLAKENNDDVELNYYRSKLLSNLSSMYAKVKTFNIKQMHFHLANNDSFLRLHKPQKFGDNLSEIRKTVVYVNEEHKSISGFEEGKVSNGYRFVFPLSYKGKHIGSVETSISMKAILDVIKSNSKSKIAFIVSKKVVNEKVFKSESNNYELSKITQDYLYERELYQEDRKTIEDSFSKYKKENEDYQSLLDSGKVFGFSNKVDGKYRVTTFYPIVNAITKKRIAYLIDTRISLKVQEINIFYFSVWIFLFLVNLFVFIGFYRVRRAQEIATEATNTKSIFLANMSHEIRTPMNAIIGFSDIMERGQLDEKQSKYLGFIKSSSKNLLAIINDILDFSKIEAGKLELEMIPFSMNEIGENLCATLNVIAKDKNIKLNFNCQNSYTGKVIGDATRMSQIIINLVNNAVKFTNEGEVNLRINTFNETDIDLEYQIIVSDSGIGIKKEALSRLFESFEQADSQTTRKYGGTGLGLSITQSLVHLMDGKIEADSTIDVGSEFTVTLKFDKYIDVEEIQIEKLTNSKKVNLSSLDVLVVEDNKTNQVLIDIILDEHGIDAVIANDGVEAIHILERRIFDLILMDIQMPNMNGYEATKVIRDINSKVLDHDVEVVALSANATVEDVKLSNESGMNKHLAKPIDAQKLHQVLVNNLKNRKN